MSSCINGLPVVHEKYKVDLSIREITGKIVVLVFIKDENDVDTMRHIELVIILYPLAQQSTARLGQVCNYNPCSAH